MLCHPSRRAAAAWRGTARVHHVPLHLMYLRHFPALASLNPQGGSYLTCPLNGRRPASAGAPPRHPPSVTGHSAPRKGPRRWDGGAWPGPGLAVAAAATQPSGGGHTRH